jgi:nitroreductase
MYSLSLTMDIENCIMGRRSIRKYKPGRVSDEVIRRGIELAEAAPDAGNLQEREYVVVRDAAVKKALSRASLGQTQPQSADVVVVFCSSDSRISDYGKRGIELYAPQDVAAAVQNFLLYIHSQGLGAVWIGAFNESQVCEALGLPRHIRPLAIVPVGMPGEVPRQSEKRPLNEKIHREKWD